MVRRGDTFLGIARKFGITYAQLLNANPGIINPANINIGQLINIPISAPSPIPTTYSISSGDTLRRIASRYGLTLGQILAANPSITNPNSIYVGMRMILPGTAPAPGITIYNVRPGDTLGGIARRFNTSTGFLLQLNPDVTNAALIYVGQQLFVPISFNIVPPGCIAYISGRTGESEVWRSDPSGRNQIQLTGVTGPRPESVDQVKWSPDGRYISYRDNGRLVVMDPCGRNPMILAQNVWVYNWSPDGSYLAFSIDDVIYTVNLQGNIGVMESLNRQIQSISFFPDGRRIAGGLLIEPPQQTIAPYTVLYTMDSNGQNFKAYDNPYVPAKQLIISPNGRYAASMWDWQGVDIPEYSIMLYDFTTGKLSRLAYNKIMGGFTPDSSRFLYASSGINPSEISIVSIPDGNILRSFRASAYVFELQWGVSPEWLIYGMTARYSPIDVAPDTSIVIHNLVTNQLITLASTGYNVSPDWNIVPCPVCR
mgnify:CR=1 FL=1